MALPKNTVFQLFLSMLMYVRPMRDLRIYWSGVTVCFGGRKPGHAETMHWDFNQPGSAFVTAVRLNLVYWNRLNRGGHIAAFDESITF